MDVEKELKKAVASRDSTRIREAFAAFYKTNVRLVYRVLIDAYGKDEEIDDDVQEAFASLLDDPSKIAKAGNLREYLLQSARYITGRRIKKKAKLEEITEEAADEKQRESQSIFRDELFGKVEQLLGHPDSDIVILHAAYHYTEREIARRLGLGEDAVHYRYKKGIKILRRHFKHDEKTS